MTKRLLTLQGSAKNKYCLSAFTKNKLLSHISCQQRTQAWFRQYVQIYKKGGGAEYLIITKDRLVLASALYHLHESYFHQGQKHTFGISLGASYLKGAYAPPGFIYQGHMPLISYTQRLDTPLVSLIKKSSKQSYKNIYIHP